MCASWATRPTRRRQSSPSSSASSTPSSVTDPPSYGRNRSRTAASVDLPAPLSPTIATRRPGCEVEVDAVERPLLASRVAGTQSAQVDGVVERSGLRAGGRGSATVAGASITSSTRAAERRTRWSVCVAPGRPVDELKRRQRDECDHREQDAVEVSGPNGGDADEHRAPHRDSRHRAPSAPDRRPPCARSPTRSGSARRRPPPRGASWAPAAPQTTSSGAPSIRSTTATARSPRAVAWLASARAARNPVSHGTTVAATSSVEEQDEARRREDPPDEADGHRPDEHGDPERGQHPQHQILSESTSLTRRASRSPLRNAGRPSGARRSRRS